jgi:NAD+ synthase (glutamine-hydrolysing)
VFEVAGVRVGVLICEDAWYPAAARAAAAAAGAEVLAVINASPFPPGQECRARATMRERVAETGLPLVYAHLVGGQDEVVFEGRSFALGADGSVAGRAPGFKEKLFCACSKRKQLSN